MLCKGEGEARHPGLCARSGGNEQEDERIRYTKDEDPFILPSRYADLGASFGRQQGRSDVLRGVASTKR